MGAVMPTSYRAFPSSSLHRRPRRDKYVFFDLRFVALVEKLVPGMQVGEGLVWR